ncbi:hypothetical protein HRG_005335 [Hirsutella rhossiliensis]|uniref:Uncharacterized protein n=1 Tax=Hirsutella rhossiliensis TaxID=111463 RepID=A0A9P8SIP0_9HYPO|nr:uncharacterized protein HRG_05335 [Hirsutella rhossiliensis]KAH0962825.1 hypothetical protein HRG_05335 [Hirsutella rhossiliensis]
MASESSEANAAGTPSPFAEAAREALQSQGGLEQLVKTVQAICTKEQKLQRSHSFQLVKLQSQIHELQQYHAEDVDRSTALRDDVKCLHSAVAYLKGRVANLTIELTCLEAKVDQRRPPPSAACQQALAVERYAAKQQQLQQAQPPSSSVSASSTLIDRLRDAGGSMDALADELLREQKQKLLEKLVTFPLSDAFYLDIVLGKYADEG